VKNELEVTSETLQDTYLGMPTEIARATTASFKFLLEKVWCCVTSISGHPLSRTGKETWLKSVVQSLSTFVMSCFQVPVSICDKMRSCIANHLWGFEDGQRKMHWRS
jgi:hypothetical protein